MSNKILIIDLETTGFVPPMAKIVEIGIVELDLATGDKKIIMDKVINPEISLNELRGSWIIQNKYMSEDEVLNAETFSSDIKKEIQDIFDRYPQGVTAYNNVFDFRFMDFHEFTYKKLPCPMRLITPICKIEGKYRGYKYPSAQEAYDFFFPDYGFIEKHRGADDALHEADIIKEIFDRGIFIL